MGLTIHYELSLPSKTPPATVKSKLAALRQKCLDLPFQSVGPIIELSGDECDFERQTDNPALRWLLIQASTHIDFVYGVRGVPQKIDGSKSKSHYSAKVSPARVIGFTIQPGKGCEPANVGLRQLQKSIKIRNEDDNGEAELKVGAGGWGWSRFCKTQFASDPAAGGIQNCLRCHLSVVAMLDHANELGFKVEVSDEGGFYDSRDVEAFCKALEHQNQMIAGFAGALKDAVGDGERKIESPIFSNPEFERLEMKGRERIDPKLAALIEQVAKKVRSRS